MTASRAAAPEGFRAVFSAAEFRALWAGQAQSIAGDQLARVALTVLVYDRTRSPLLTAAAYAASYVPWLIGGLVLGGLADRWPRRTVLVRCDLGRGALVAAMAMPGMPLPASVALQFAVTSLDGPFDAARAGTLRDILPGDRYRLGVAVAGSTVMTAMMAGYAAGGVLVGAIGARPALALDAATFLVSAAVIRLGVASRPAAQAASRLPVAARVTSGLALVFTDPRLRTYMLFGWLTAVYTVPSALAVPVAASLGGGPAAAGLVFAAGPLGTAAGTAVYGRRAGPERQARWMGPLAVLCCATLVLFAARPGLAWSLVIITASGAAGSFQVAANTGFMAGLRRDQQAQAFGVAVAGMATFQGLSYLAAGAAASAVPPAVVIAAWGAAGAAAALALTVGWLPATRAAAAAAGLPAGPAGPRQDGGGAS